MLPCTTRQPKISLLSDCFGVEETYMVDPAYAVAGNRPALSKAEISACNVAEFFWILILWPRPRTLPSLETRIAPFWNR